VANLEDAIRTAFASGRLKGLTCWPCSAGYQANTKNAAGGWACHVADNPVTALRLALGLETAAPAAAERSIFD